MLRLHRYLAVLALSAWPYATCGTAAAATEHAQLLRAASSVVSTADQQTASESTPAGHPQLAPISIADPSAMRLHDATLTAPERDTLAGTVSSALVDRQDPRTLASTLLLETLLEHERHRLQLSGEGNYARAPLGDRSIRAAVRNVRAVARYEYRLSGPWSFVTAVGGRRDRVIGLDMHLNVSPGLAYHLVDTTWAHLALESAYDIELRSVTVDEPTLLPQAVQDAGPGDRGPHALDHGQRFRVVAQRTIAGALRFDGAAELRRSYTADPEDRWRAELQGGLRVQLTAKSAVAAVALWRAGDSSHLRSEPTETVAALRLDQLL
jgi:hypothetical protein